MRGGLSAWTFSTPFAVVARRVGLPHRVLRVTPTEATGAVLALFLE